MKMTKMVSAIALCSMLMSASVFALEKPLTFNFDFAGLKQASGLNHLSEMGVVFETENWGAEAFVSEQFPSTSINIGSIPLSNVVLKTSAHGHTGSAYVIASFANKGPSACNLTGTYAPGTYNVKMGAILLNKTVINYNLTLENYTITCTVNKAS
ncbi:MAG: hypothetical protein NTU49_02165 [Gammaproteobacteria bacterium]|nr:hypothetical protein [Gammaproteobacteria bacterium]